MQKIGARAKTQMSGVGEVEQAKECLPPYPTILKNSLTDFSRLSSLTDWQQQVLISLWINSYCQWVWLQALNDK